MSETKEKTGWFARLKQGLRKTQVNLVGIFTGGVVDEAFLEDLEFQMISADIGVETSALILERLRERIKLKGLKTQDEVKVALKEIIADILRPCEASLNFDEHKPLVIMMCGVNGAGKTTTIGKLAKHFAQLNKKVLLAAAEGNPGCGGYLQSGCKGTTGCLGRSQSNRSDFSGKRRSRFCGLRRHFFRS